MGGVTRAVRSDIRRRRHATVRHAAGRRRHPARRAAARAAQRQPALVIGLILVIIGAVVLLTRVTDLSLGADAWPLWIVVPGVAMLLASFAVPPRGGLGLAVPGAIVATVGLVLWFQDANDAYATWAYAWALVAPTAAGLGTMLYGLAKGDRELAGDGFRTTLVGLALFAGFALFFEGVIGLSGEPIANLDEVLPYGLIGLGILFVVLSFFGGGRRRDQRRVAGSTRPPTRLARRPVRRLEGSGYSISRTA